MLFPHKWVDRDLTPAGGYLLLPPLDNISGFRLNQSSSPFDIRSDAASVENGAVVRKPQQCSGATAGSVCRQSSFVQRDCSRPHPSLESA